VSGAVAFGAAHFLSGGPTILLTGVGGSLLGAVLTRSDPPSTDTPAPVLLGSAERAT
jgi:hypothetical protein